MKRIHKIKARDGGYIEVQLLKRNTHSEGCPEDLIWLHYKRPKLSGKGFIEDGFSMTPYEAELIMNMLWLAIQEILKKYKLYNFKVKTN